MGGKNWSKSEIKALERNYPRESAESLSKELGRSKYSIYTKASELGIKSELCGSGRRWNEKETQILREEYSSKTASEVANLLDRSVDSVKSKAGKMEITERKNLSKAEKSKVRRLHLEGKDLKNIASEMELPLALVQKAICNKEKLKKLYEEEDLTQKGVAEELGGSPCICSTDRKELEFLHALLSNLGINCSKRKQMVYVLKSSRNEFFKKIDPIIKKNPSGE